MAEFEFTRDYRKLWKEAQDTHNYYAMNELFQQLANESEVPDPTGEAAQISSGKALAELLNAKDRGDGGIKV